MPLVLLLTESAELLPILHVPLKLTIPSISKTIPLLGYMLTLFMPNFIIPICMFSESILMEPLRVTNLGLYKNIGKCMAFLNGR